MNRRGGCWENWKETDFCSRFWQTEWLFISFWSVTNCWIMFLLCYGSCVWTVHRFNISCCSLRKTPLCSLASPMQMKSSQWFHRVTAAVQFNHTRIWTWSRASELIKVASSMPACWTEYQTVLYDYFWMMTPLEMSGFLTEGFISKDL